MTIRYFGIRHHGPGCARSLLKALDDYQPELLLVEGPPEGEPLLVHLASSGLQPPVALLTHAVDDPRWAVYHPFAEFSPEWQALRWAQKHGVATRFIDLPLTHSLALAKATDALASEAAAKVEGQDDHAPSPSPSSPAAPPGEVPETAAHHGQAGGADHNQDTDLQPEPVGSPQDLPLAHPCQGEAEDGQDWRQRRLAPLDWLAQAAGHGDGESWWNHLVEERIDGTDLFEAINEAMTTLRQEWTEAHSSQAGSPDDHENQREALREAHMRQCIRAAEKEGHARVAVICGAWHLGGLQAKITAKADSALLKGLPKLKTSTTWIPWSHPHLTRDSGYGAGVSSPGWYEHLWRHPGTGLQRTAGWLGRVAQAMRDRDLDCSSAHLIEACRLAEGLAAMRGRPAPGLPELEEACRAVLTMGDDAALEFIRQDLMVGHRMGQVPTDVPAVPLQRDLEQQQKSLRLKPEAAAKLLDLDLRQPTDLARSHLLHRLRLLDVPWGELAKVGRTGKGTFHEVWNLQWEPGLALRLIEASRHGQTLAVAAATKAVADARLAPHLQDLAALIDRVLLADLPEAARQISGILEDQAALTGDTTQLLAALGPLANICRYGNVRQTDASTVAHVIDSLVVRASLGLPVACWSLSDEAAAALRDPILAGHAAVNLRDDTAQTACWMQGLAQVSRSDAAHPLLSGLATRLLLDGGQMGSADAGVLMSRHLSPGCVPSAAAAWLEGFINQNAVVLMHDARVWQLVDDWLCQLPEAHFVSVLPLVRRTFSTFTPSERADLALKASASPSAAGPGAAAPEDGQALDLARAELALPMLARFLGLPEAVFPSLEATP